MSIGVRSLSLYLYIHESIYQCETKGCVSNLLLDMGSEVNYVPLQFRVFSVTEQ